MSKLIRHRGPDDVGYLLIDKVTYNQTQLGGEDTPNQVFEYNTNYKPTKSILDTESSIVSHAFAHRRLSILDLSPLGHQPLSYLNNQFWIIFNGEVYNYIEIRNELINQGIEFKSSSDSEVLLKLLIHKGPEALSALNGMWSFVLYDKVEKTFLISRDRLGEKPLYYVQKGEKFAFASEMKSLYNCLDQFEYDIDVINFYKTNPNNGNLSKTIIKEIQKFPAGYYALFKNEKLEFKQYYNPGNLLLGNNKNYKSIHEAVEEFTSLFQSSCMLRMRSDVPVGSSLSGGIDSGLVVNTISAQRSFDTNYKAIVASFPGSVLDETDSAIQIAKNARVEAVKVIIKPSESPDEILKSAYHFEEIAGTSPIPFFQTYNAFRENGIYVTLDGHGGDELFGGYASDIADKLVDDFPNLFRMRSTMQTIENIYGNDRKISLGLSWLYFSQQWEKRKKEGVSFFDKTIEYKKRLHFSTFEGILPTLLRNYDKYSMFAGVEVRMPFLDFRIVDFAFKLPNKYKVNHGFSKLLLRKAGEGILPSNIVNNKIKIGWNTPMGEWLNGKWKEWLLDELSSTEFANCNLVNKEKIKKMVDEFYITNLQDQDQGQLIWLKLQPYLIEKANKKYHNFKD
jgi:asparagine synthase (glutamine-hydrolysing)